MVDLSAEAARGSLFERTHLVGSMAGALIASIPVAIAYNLFLDRFIAGYHRG